MQGKEDGRFLVVNGSGVTAASIVTHEPGALKAQVRSRGASWEGVWKRQKDSSSAKMRAATKKFCLFGGSRCLIKKKYRSGPTWCQRTWRI